MKKTYVHISLLFFLITALSGVLMRAFPYFPNFFIPYDHILHAHSHIALLGWAFLGVFVIFLKLEWERIAKRRQAMIICFTLFVVSLCMFFAFLGQGYGFISILFSTLHIFAEYWAVIFIYRYIKRNRYLPKLSSLYYKGALLALIISSFGPYSLAIISANGWKDGALYDMSIYFYLHFQYNGWLTLFLIGLLITILSSQKIQFKQRYLKLGFWLYFFSLFPGYLLSVLWVEGLTSFANVLAAAGSIGQWIGVLFILFAFHGYKKYFSKLEAFGLKITFLLLFLKSTSELGLISPVLAELVYDTRSVVIGYLHLTLLGFISIFILTQFALAKLLPINQKSRNGFAIFFIGLIMNELLLFADAFLQWIGIRTLPFHISGLLIASILLALGIFIIWSSVMHKSSQ